MKKLAITLVTVAVGLAANAASYSWSTKGRIYDGTGDTADYASGQTAYLMFSSISTQSALVTSFVNDAATAKATVTGSAVASGVINSDARVSVSGITYDTTSVETAYYVIFANDKMYVSGTTSAGYDSLNPDAVKTIEFAAETAASRLTFADTTTTYSGAGWYTSVPEPTSGLLMLIGMAGLALRRRHA